MYSAFGLNVIVPNDIRAPAPAWNSRGFVYQPAKAFQPIGEAKAGAEARTSAPPTITLAITRARAARGVMKLLGFIMVVPSMVLTPERARESGSPQVEGRA